MLLLALERCANEEGQLASLGEEGLFSKLVFADTEFDPSEKRILQFGFYAPEGMAEGGERLSPTCRTAEGAQNGVGFCHAVHSATVAVEVKQNFNIADHIDLHEEKYKGKEPPKNVPKASKLRACEENGSAARIMSGVATCAI